MGCLKEQLPIITGNIYLINFSNKLARLNLIIRMEEFNLNINNSSEIKILFFTTDRQKIVFWAKAQCHRDFNSPWLKPGVIYKIVRIGL